MVPNTIIGVMGPGNGASAEDMRMAESLGKEIARKGWVLLTGGRPEGVMHAASRGAGTGGGTTVGILPGEDPAEASRHVGIPICTGMGSARNNINVLSSTVVVACGSGPGTLSEVMLAVKAGRPLILLNQPESVARCVTEAGGTEPARCASVDDAIRQIEQIIET